MLPGRTRFTPSICMFNDAKPVELVQLDPSHDPLSCLGQVFNPLQFYLVTVARAFCHRSYFAGLCGGALF